MVAKYRLNLIVDPEREGRAAVAGGGVRTARDS